MPRPKLAGPPWVYTRLAAATTPQAVRYESSYYGPINSWLGCYFTVPAGFMIKPQAKIRPPAVDSDLGRVSIDSYGGQVVARAVGGRELGLLEPDFIVVRASEKTSDDIMVLIIEVKRNNVSIQKATEQITDYMEAFAAKIRQDTSHPLVKGTLRGLLIVGGEVTVLTLVVGGQMGFGGTTSFQSTDLHELLREISQ